MKIARVYTIDYELAQKLDNEQNKSGLVNSLIKAYYDKFDIDKMSPEQIQREARKVEAYEEFQKKCKEIDAEVSA